MAVDNGNSDRHQLTVKKIFPGLAMNKPHLYHKANTAQRYDAAEVIKEYWDKINCREDGNCSMIDIGSGTGNVLFDLIYPRLPKNFQKIVCSDLNPNMVNYAKKSYGSYEKTDFKILNIESKHEMPNYLNGQFDIVTSFYTLHWVQNQRLAYENIYKLLRPDGGVCLHIYLASILILDVFYKLRESPKWFDYMKDIERFTSPLHKSNDRKGDLDAILKELKFSEYSVEIREKVFVYESEQIFRDNMLAINPYLDSVPSSLHQHFMDDFIQAAIDLGMLRKDKNGREFHVPYKLAVVFARK